MQKTTRNRILSWLLPVIILLMPMVMKLALFVDIVPEGHGLGGDAVNTMYPWITTSTRAIASGQLPVWTPYEGLGRPLYSNIQAASWYPPTWILAVVSGGTPGYTLFQFYLLLHLGLGGLGLYYLSRSLTLRRSSAFVAALVFQGGGFFVGHISMLSIVASAAWIPWIFLAWMLGREGRLFIWAPALALFCALSFLGGQPQPTYYAILVLILWTIIETIRTSSSRPVLLLVTAGAIAAAFSAPVLIPGLRELPLLERGQPQWREHVDSGRFLWQGLRSIFLPHYPDELAYAIKYSYFFTITGALLAITGLFSSRDSRYWLFLSGLLLATLLAFSGGLFGEDVVTSIFQGYGLFKEHYRAGVLMLVFVSIFAACGVEKVLGGKGSARREMALAAGLAVAVSVLGIIQAGDPGASFWKMVAVASVVTGALLIAVLAVPAKAWKAGIIITVATAEVLYIGLNNNMHRGIPEMIEHRRELAGQVPRSGPYPPRVTWGPNYNLQTLDVAFGLNTFYSWDANQYRRLRRLWGITENNPLFFKRYGIEFWRSGREIEQTPRSPEIFTMNRKNQLQRYPLLAETTGAMVEIELAGGLPDRDEMLAAVVCLADGSSMRMELESVTPAVVLSAPVPAAVEIEAVVVSWNGEGEVAVTEIRVDSRPVSLAPEYELVAPTTYRITDGVPRAFIVPALSPVTRDKQVPGRMITGRDLDETAVIVRPENFELYSAEWNAGQFVQAEVRFDSYRAQEVVLTTESPDDAYLVVTDFHHPGWKAFVNGREVPLWRANLAVRVVPVPQGSSEVVFRYEDWLVALGLWCWLAGVMAACGLVFTAFRNRTPVQT